MRRETDENYWKLSETAYTYLRTLMTTSKCHLKQTSRECKTLRDKVTRSNKPSECISTSFTNRMAKFWLWAMRSKQCFPLKSIIKWRSLYYASNEWLIACNAFKARNLRIRSKILTWVLEKLHYEASKVLKYAWWKEKSFETKTLRWWETIASWIIWETEISLWRSLTYWCKVYPWSWCLEEENW